MHHFDVSNWNYILLMIHFLSCSIGDVLPDGSVLIQFSDYSQEDPDESISTKASMKLEGAIMIRDTNRMWPARKKRLLPKIFEDSYGMVAFL